MGASSGLVAVRLSTGGGGSSRDSRFHLNFDLLDLAKLDLEI